MSIYDRWADDEKYGDAGLAPADEELPLHTQALALSIHNEINGPWARYMNIPENDEAAFEEWKRWMRDFLETELPIIKQAIGLASQGTWEPYRRFLKLPDIDDEAHEEWRKWFIEYQERENGGGDEPAEGERR